MVSRRSCDRFCLYLRSVLNMICDDGGIRGCRDGTVFTTLQIGAVGLFLVLMVPSEKLSADRQAINDHSRRLILTGSSTDCDKTDINQKV